MELVAKEAVATDIDDVWLFLIKEDVWAFGTYGANIEDVWLLRTNEDV